MRRICSIAVVLMLAACSSTDGRLGRDNPSAEIVPAPRTGSWSLRDDVPYARLGQTAVLDEGNDRMIVFGGGANDVWALPLSGPSAHEWTQLFPEGEYPAAHTTGSSLFGDSAVYDPVGRRMLLLRAASPVTGGEVDEVRLFELSLTNAPRWKELLIAGPSPGAEIQSGRLALDVRGRRLFAAGGTYQKSGVWSLSLGDTMAWTRVSDMPPQPGAFYVETSLFFDAARSELVLFGGHGRLPQIWGLSLRDATWSVLDEGTDASGSYGASAVFDAAGDRIVIVGGDQSGITSFSFESRAWSEGLNTEPSVQGASAVLDQKRHRILRFGGGGEYDATNAVSAVALDTLAVSEVVPGSRRRNFRMDEHILVWDPVRQGVVAYGDYAVGDTWFRDLAARDGWELLASVGFTTPRLSYSVGVYDPEERAILSFGGYQYRETNRLIRLPSEPGAVWETLDAGAGPAERSSHLTVLDEANRRLVVYGGIRNSSYPPSEKFDDCWALSLDGPMAWTKLEPQGTSPGARDDLVGIYDPEGQRLIAVGEFAGDLHALSLGSEPEWSTLHGGGRAWMPGDSPAYSFRRSAVYDPAGNRMIVLRYSTTGAAQLFALELGGDPAWHEFCSPGITPAATLDVEGSASTIVRVPDGLFLTVSGGAFRFDLETPYCDN